MADDTETQNEASHGLTVGDFTPISSLNGETLAADRLRAFEDEHFGPAAVRIDGKIERGVGSPFAMAPDEIREQHARIEHLIVTEQKLADAHAALIAADSEHEAAMLAVEEADDAAAR